MQVIKINNFNKLHHLVTTYKHVFVYVKIKNINGEFKPLRGQIISCGKSLSIVRAFRFPPPKSDYPDMSKIILNGHKISQKLEMVVIQP